MRGKTALASSPISHIPCVRLELLTFVMFLCLFVATQTCLTDQLHKGFWYNETNWQASSHFVNGFFNGTQACPRFCVNGLMAGNCQSSQRKRNDRKQRIHDNRNHNPALDSMKSTTYSRICYSQPHADRSKNEAPKALRKHFRSLHVPGLEAP